MNTEQIRESIALERCDCAKNNATVNDRCKICGGSGFLVVAGEHRYAWHAPMTLGEIRAREAEEAVRISLGMAALVIALTGIGALVFLVETHETWTQVFDHLRYGSHISAVLVWVGMLGISYFIYRVTEEHLREADLAEVVRPGHVNTAKGRTGARTRDYTRYFSKSALHAVKHAYLLAHKLGHQEAGALHMFASLLTESSIGLLVARLAVDRNKLITSIKHLLAKKSHGSGVNTGSEWHRILGEAFIRAVQLKHRQVYPSDIMSVITAPVYEEIDAIITDLDLSQERIMHVAAWVELQREMARQARRFLNRAAYKPQGAMNRAYTSVATPVLDRFSRDLTSRAALGAVPMIVGRERELGEIYKVFQSGERGVLLVGSGGSGKTAIVGQVAQAMAAEDVPEEMADRRFVELSVPALVAGGGSGGGLEKTLLHLAREIRRAGNVILVVENVQNLVGTKSEGGSAFDVAAVLAEEVEHGSLTMIATTTPEAMPLVEHSALGRLLTRINVGETDREATIRVLESKAPYLEHRFGVFFSYPAIEHMVDAGERYLSEGAMPDKAVRLMEEVGESVKEERGGHTMVTKEDVAHVISRRTNIPLSSLTENEQEVLLHFEARLHERVIGQEEAVTLIANAVRRSRADIRERTRPIASFLFLGPTGVGKTEVARALAAIYFGDEGAMIRLDMTEYQGPDALEKLLGNKTAGTQGYLTEAVRQRPFSLILLDEFEKASGETLNLFLQVFEDGRLTDALGRTANFTNTIIIATSNAGAETILTGLRAGKSMEDIKTLLIQEELPRRFRPELINRFDGVVVFKPLSVEDVEAIARLQLKRVERELNERGIALKVEEVAVHDLAREGYDPVYGARPLKRLIQERVENPIAEYIVAGELKHRDTVILEYGGKPRVEKAPPL